MTKEELIAFLKEKLEIQISISSEYARYGDGLWRTVEVSLSLGDEVISTCSETLPSES